MIVPPSNTTINHTTDDSLLSYRDEDFHLNCTANGYRAPNFTWTVNGTINITELSQMPNSQYSFDSARGQVLTVSRATYRDHGTYTCTAANKAGSDTASVNIVIKGKNNAIAFISRCRYNCIFLVGTY